MNIGEEREYALRNTRTGEVNDYTYGYPDYDTNQQAFEEARDALRDWERDTGDRHEIVSRVITRGAWA